MQCLFLQILLEKVQPDPCTFYNERKPIFILENLMEI